MERREQHKSDANKANSNCIVIEQQCGTLTSTKNNKKVHFQKIYELRSGTPETYL